MFGTVEQGNMIEGRRRWRTAANSRKKKSFERRVKRKKWTAVLLTVGEICRTLKNLALVTADVKVRV